MGQQYFIEQKEIKKRIQARIARNLGEKLKERKGKENKIFKRTVINSAELFVPPRKKKKILHSKQICSEYIMDPK